MPSDLVTDRLLGALSWEWQDAEELMDLLIPIVPPGKALRKYLDRIEKAEKDRGSPVSEAMSRGLRTEDEQIASGARQIVNDRIKGQRDGGRIEQIIDEDGTRRLRFRERREVADDRGCCPTCNRPFVQPTTVPEKMPPPKSKVLYPIFPSWEKVLNDKAGHS